MFSSFVPVIWNAINRQQVCVSYYIGWIGGCMALSASYRRDLQPINANSSCFSRRTNCRSKRLVGGGAASEGRVEPSQTVRDAMQPAGRKEKDTKTGG